MIPPNARVARAPAVLLTGLAVCAVAAAAAVGGPRGVARGADADPSSGSSVVLRGIAKPSADVRVAFTISGRISDRFVDPGDTVTSGGALLALDDGVVKLEVAQLAAAAASTARLDAARAVLELEETDLKRAEQLLGSDVSGQFELELAEVEVHSAQASVAVQEEARTLAALRLQAAERALAEYTLKSPIDGTVEDVLLDEGETVRALDPIVRIVQTNPLLVEVAVPTRLSLALSAGDALDVELASADGPVWVESVVQSIASVADAGSQTRLVRLHTPNDAGLPAGTRVSVRVPNTDR